MARIKQLPPHEAQKIAAGEVVERPANVVKELIENALDAGATTLFISIEDAGKALIRVIDNGCGMSEQDAQLCFAHHATSKINTVEDLPSLLTFGFRGEALSSISAVSQVTLTTKEAEASHGTCVTLEAGSVISQESATCNNGTDIAIRNLFYNVPARKKFLKTRETELRQIVQLFQAYSLDYLNVHFKLISDNNQLFNCPPVTLIDQRIAQLWDHTIAQQMIAITTQDTQRDILVNGMISNHTYARYDRSSIFFFVNKRWVKNHTLSKALLKGYLNVLQPDRYPTGCVFLTINPATVDINIHPRKEEVQFLNPKVVESLIQQSVKTALEEHLSSSLNRKVHLQEDASSFQSARKIHTYHHTPTHDHSHPSLTFVNNFAHTYAPVPEKKTFEYHEQKPLPLPFEHEQMQDQKNTNYQIIGQLKKTYILIEQEEGLFIVDQHAAHERILYEIFSSRFDEVASIKLMFPQVITLKEAEFHILEAHLEFFKLHHIEIEFFGDNQIIIQSIPSYLKEVPLDSLIQEAIGWIIEFQHLDLEQFSKKINEKLHAQMACKAAVKAGDALTNTQMHQLLDDLSVIENRFTCPHGRPTGWAISLYEIEKKFKRKN